MGVRQGSDKATSSDSQNENHASNLVNQTGLFALSGLHELQKMMPLGRDYICLKIKSLTASVSASKSRSRSNVSHATENFTEPKWQSLVPKV